MADELVSEEEAARRKHIDEQHDAHLCEEARMCGVMRRALKDEGFTDEGAEQIAVRWYDDWLEGGDPTG